MNYEHLKADSKDAEDILMLNGQIGKKIEIDAVVVGMQLNCKSKYKKDVEEFHVYDLRFGKHLIGGILSQRNWAFAGVFQRNAHVRIRCFTNGKKKSGLNSFSVVIDSAELLSTTTDNQLKFEDVKPKTLNTQSEPEQLFLNMVLGKEPDGLRIMSQYMIPGLAYRPDFALINTITKEVILFIEIDGKQHTDAKAMFNDHQRDQVILAETKIPILRLPASLVYAIARHLEIK